MSFRLFLRQIILITFATALLILSLSQVRVLRPDLPLAWASLAFFVLLSFLMYVTGAKAAQHRNKSHFINVVLGFTIGKMIFSVALIALYALRFHPASKLFALPFFGVYLIYTIFETTFMTRIGKMK